MEWKKRGYLISTRKDQLQVRKVHRFLSTQAYWCLGISQSKVSRAIKNSLCFGVYQVVGTSKVQMGFARVVSDFTTFAWLCDVYIEKEYRKQGLSKWLLECIVSYPRLKGLRRFCLATRDAHGLYAQFGFQVTETPDRWMEIKSKTPYLRAAKSQKS